MKTAYENRPYVKAALAAPHKVVFSDKDTLVLYHERADTYIAEGDLKKIAAVLRDAPVNRLETSNEAVFRFFEKSGRFKHAQICVQCAHEKTTGKANLFFPTDDEIGWIADTYGKTESDVRVMRGERRVFVYRENGVAVCYIGIHVDGSVGLLYTKPECRRKGYAALTENELFKIAPAPIFAHILADNDASVRLHEKNGWTFSGYKIYWLFDESF